MFSSLLSKIVIIAVGLLLPRLTMVNYGSEINGLLNSANQIVTYLTLFEAGVQAVALKSLYGPVYQDDKYGINQILSAVHVQYKRTGTLYLVGLLGISFAYALAIKSATISFYTAFLLVFFSGFGKVILFFFQGKYKILLQAEGKSYIDVNIQTIISVLTGLAKVILMNMRVNVVLVIGVSLLISLLQAGYIMYHIHKHYGWLDLTVEPNHCALKEKNAALIHQVSALVFQNTDVIILTFFCNLKIVSVYSIYKLIVTHLSSILYAVYDSFNFSLGQQFQTDKCGFIKRLNFVEVYYPTMAFAVYSVAYLLFPDFISLYTRGIQDVNYLDPYLPILFVTIELLTIGRMPLLNVIHYAGHFQKTLSKTVMETIINLTVSLSLVNVLGIKGVLLGTIAALLFRCVDMLIYSNSRILQRTLWHSLGAVLINWGLFMGVVVIKPILTWQIQSYWQFVVAGCVLMPLCLVSFLGIQTVFHKEERQMLRTFQNK